MEGISFPTEVFTSSDFTGESDFDASSDTAIVHNEKVQVIKSKILFINDLFIFLRFPVVLIALLE